MSIQYTVYKGKQKPFSKTNLSTCMVQFCFNTIGQILKSWKKFKCYYFLIKNVTTLILNNRKIVKLTEFSNHLKNYYIYSYIISIQ